MNHAILITAYKNVHHLVAMANSLDERFRIYIHLDKKSKVSDSELKTLSDHKRVAYISQKYEVHWAGVNHLLAILHLLEESLKSPDNHFFHTLSGQDFPIKTSEQIIEFFKSHPNKQFIENFAMPAGHWTHGGMHRIWHFYFFDYFNHKNKWGNFANRAVNKFQRISTLKRKWPAELPPLYGGGTWWSLTRPCVELVMKYTHEQPEFLKRLRFTLCPEELYFQTIIMNSKFASEAVCDHLRYIDWASRNNNSPANLDETDFEKLVTSDKLFARKFEYPVSQKLIEQFSAKASN